MSENNLLESRVLWGHYKKFRSPRIGLHNKSFNRIFNLDVFDADKIKEQLLNASEVLKKYNRILIFFNKKILDKTIISDLKKIFSNHKKCFLITGRWLGGTLTNSKEVNVLPLMPNLLFSFSVAYDEIAIKEASKLNIKTMGICDSNSHIEKVDYPILGNDDHRLSLKFFLDFLASNISEKTENTGGKENKGENSTANKEEIFLSGKENKGENSTANKEEILKE